MYNITPIYLLPNALAAVLLSTLTGISNSEELTDAEIEEASELLIYTYGYEDLYKRFYITSDLDIQMLEHFEADLGFNVIPLLREENKTQVFDLITMLNEDEHINYELCRFNCGLFSNLELVTETIIPPPYEKLTSHKLASSLEDQSKSQQLLHTLNLPHFDDLIPSNIFAEDFNQHTDYDQEEIIPPTENEP